MTFQRLERFGQDVARKAFPEDKWDYHSDGWDTLATTLLWLSLLVFRDWTVDGWLFLWGILGGAAFDLLRGFCNFPPQKKTPRQERI